MYGVQYSDCGRHLRSAAYLLAVRVRFCEYSSFQRRQWPYEPPDDVSIEAEIEASKETYYEALSASSAGWHEGKSDYVPFVTYMLGVIAACYATLDARASQLTSSAANEDILRAYFDGLVGKVTKRQIMDDNPVMSQRTIERLLQKMQVEGSIEKIGAARATRYRKVRS